MPSTTWRNAIYLILGVAFLAFHLYHTPAQRRRPPPPEGIPESVLRLADKRVVALDEILPDLRAVPLVFVGELHDQPFHHWAQLEVIRRLHEAEVDLAIGLEMMRADYQKALDRWVAGELSEGEFVPIFERNWKSWAQYAAIFRYAREHGIPLVGLNVSRQITRQVAREGFSSLSSEQLKELPPVRCDVDEVYQEFIRRALGFEGKGGLPFKNFCEAQIVWDSVMAWHLERFLDTNSGYTVVVLAGSAHSWKRGIPEQIRRRSARASRTILPEIDRLSRENATLEDADYLWLGLPLMRSL